MFQFRRFPTYYYFIHSTLTRYCRAGFPHSDIHGSRDICSSPWLFAACRVLHRLLMPRHSPCALSSLTFVVANFAPFTSAVRLRLSSKVHLRFVAPPLKFKARFEFVIWIATCYGLHSCSQNYAGIHRRFRLLLCYPKSSTSICCCHTLTERGALCCLAFSSSSSVQFSRCRTGFEAGTKYSKSLLSILV